MLYTHQWTSETHVFIKNISLILFSKRAHSLLLVWEIDGETYTQRGDFFLSHIFFRGQEVPTLAHLASRIVRDNLTLWSAACPSFDSRFSTLSKSDRVVIMWSPSGYTPVGPDCPDALSPSSLLITTWQLVKEHGVTRNKPKIQVICYITSVAGLINMSIPQTFTNESSDSKRQR